MFTGYRAKKTSQVEVLNTAVTQMANMAKAMTSGVQSPAAPALPKPTTQTGVSPGKIASLRSNYLQQMRDLHLLYESGALTDKEFCEQKIPILEQLKQMSPSL